MMITAKRYMFTDHLVHHVVLSKHDQGNPVSSPALVEPETTTRIVTRIQKEEIMEQMMEQSSSSASSTVNFTG